ncbi:MAG: rod shape-determining protein MreD [Aquificaceae bacterium]|nr:rod shape-determining protein MreD [Aquificaceae bacterium]
MKFYLLAPLLAYFQSSVLMVFFQSFLFAPNLLLAYLFIELMREKGYGLKKGAFSGLLLDLLQDSLGLHLFSHTLFTMAINAMKSRFEPLKRFSLLLAYVPFSLMERLCLFVLFRLKYFAEFRLGLALVGFLLEFIFLLILLRWYPKSGV